MDCLQFINLRVAQTIWETYLCQSHQAHRPHLIPHLRIPLHPTPQHHTLPRHTLWHQNHPLHLFPPPK